MVWRKIVFNLRYPAFWTLLFVNSIISTAQNQPEILPDSITLEDCIKYSIKNQPYLKQLLIDENIARQDIRISFSDWLPQISSSAGIQHYINQPVSLFPNLSDLTGPRIPITTALKNNGSFQFSATQNIFTNDLYFAGRTAKYYRQQSGQKADKGNIQLISDVSKAFYDVLLSEQMVKIIDEEIARLTRSLNDALALFKSGTTDKIDFSRATMALNNTKSDKIRVVNSIKVKQSYLKQLMGYPDDKPLVLKYNILEMEKDIMIDTLQDVRYSDRIEYKLLQTNLRLQQISVSYYKQSFLPSLSGFVNYNIIYQDDNFGQLYNKTFPNSSIGLNLSFPLFEGTKRAQNLKKSKFLYQRMALDTISLKDEMRTEYIQAITTYKSNLAAYNITLENIKIADDVYSTVMEQYKQGIKTYLEEIISETDLQTAYIENLRALTALMFSKIDVQQATGKIAPIY
jgi:outer membrane protein